MTTIALDIPLFRAQFSPVFDNVTTFPDALITLFWGNATAYVSDQTGGCYIGGMNVAQKTLALNYMTAHLLTIRGMIGSNSGAPRSTGLKQASTIDKVSVTLTPPPLKNQWQWWLSLTPYGQELLALLQVTTVGGFYLGGTPVYPAFRT